MDEFRDLSVYIGKINECKDDEELLRIIMEIYSMAYNDGYDDCEGHN